MKTYAFEVHHPGSTAKPRVGRVAAACVAALALMIPTLHGASNPKTTSEADGTSTKCSLYHFHYLGVAEFPFPKLAVSQGVKSLVTDCKTTTVRKKYAVVKRESGPAAERIRKQVRRLNKKAQDEKIPWVSLDEDHAVSTFLDEEIHDCVSYESRRILPLAKLVFMVDVVNRITCFPVHRLNEMVRRDGLEGNINCERALCELASVVGMPVTLPIGIVSGLVGSIFCHDMSRIDYDKVYKEIDIVTGKLGCIDIDDSDISFVATDEDDAISSFKLLLHGVDNDPKFRVIKCDNGTHQGDKEVHDALPK